MPFDFVAYDAKCAQLAVDELQKEWEHYTRQIAGASTSTAVSGLAIPLTAGVSVIGVGLAAPTIHNARKKREIIERHLQRHGTTHQTRKRDVAGSMAFSGTLGVLTLGVGAVGHEAVMTQGAEHGVSHLMNETAIKIGMHAALDGAAMATEEAHHAHKKEKAASKLQRLKQQAQSFTSEKPRNLSQAQPNTTYATVAIPGVYSNHPYNPQFVAPPGSSVAPAPVAIYQQSHAPVYSTAPPSPMPQPIIQAISPPPIIAPIPQHVTQHPMTTTVGVSPSPTPAPPPYTGGPPTPYVEKVQPLSSPMISTPLPAYNPQTYGQSAPQVFNQLQPQLYGSQPQSHGTVPAMTTASPYHQQQATQNLPSFTAYVSAPGFNPPVPFIPNANIREQHLNTSNTFPVAQSVPPSHTEIHQPTFAATAYAPPTPQATPYTQGQWQNSQPPVQAQQQGLSESYFPHPSNSIELGIPQSYTPAPTQHTPVLQACDQKYATYQPGQPSPAPLYAYSQQYQVNQSLPPQQPIPIFQPQQSLPPIQQSTCQPAQQQAPLMTPPPDYQNQLAAYDPSQWQDAPPSPMPTSGYEKINQSQPASAYPGGMNTNVYPTEKTSAFDSMNDLSKIYGNMRVS